MTGFPFEDKKKKDLRVRCAQAVDAAGYQLVDPSEQVDLPEGAELNGTILGDLQARDSDGLLYIYYLRTPDRQAVPGWLQNFARQALKVEGVRLFVVVNDVSAVITQSCRSCGAGLLELVNGSGFRLVLEPSGNEMARLNEELAEEVTKLRRLLEHKVNVVRIGIEADIVRTRSLTTGMPGNLRGLYLAVSEARIENLRGWGESLSARIDAAQSVRRFDDLAQIRRDINQGFIE